MESTTLFLLDNIDSFSYNLVDEMRKLGYPLKVYRNRVDADIIIEQINQTKGKVVLILSPGPGTPEDAGCMPELLKRLAGTLPVLGICLGHQAIVAHHGGKVVRANQVLHGKSSAIDCKPHPIFADLPNPLPVARYHSLMASQLPDELTLLAQYESIPMAVYHGPSKMLGFQFHPESILTSQGAQLLKQSIEFLAEQA